MSGNKAFGTFRVSYGISYSLDTEISLSRPESWRESVPGKTFSESDERVARVRNSEVQHTSRSYTYGDDNSTEICGKCSGGENKRNDK